MNQQDQHDNGTGKVRDYVSQRMNAEMPPDFVGGVMSEVRQTPQRGRWRGWPMVASFATIAAAIAVVGIGLSLVDDGEGVGSSMEPSPSMGVSPSVAPSQAPETEPETPSPSPSPSDEPLPSGEFGPVWSMDPDVAFPDAQSCENPFGLPTMEYGDNVAWRIWRPASWVTQEAYTGGCMWFGPQAWDLDPDGVAPPEEVAIVISVLDGRVTPTSPEFEGGTITTEERFTVDGLPAIRYEIAASDGQFLNGDGVVWVIGAEGQLPDFDTGQTPNYLVIYTSATGAGRLVQQVEVLDRMVATLQITDR